MSSTFHTTLESKYYAILLCGLIVQFLDVVKLEVDHSDKKSSMSEDLFDYPYWQRTTLVADHEQYQEAQDVSHR
jgi:hypothetical protein